MRWRTDGHMVLDDHTGASISCLGPTTAPNFEAMGAALAQRVAIALNDGERQPTKTTAALLRGRRALAWLAWPTIPTVIGVAVLNPHWRTELACIAIGAAVGVAGPVLWVWGNRKDAEAARARKDIAYEHAIDTAVALQEAEDRISGEHVAIAVTDLEEVEQ